jgi:tRNA-dihydrouridine synthase
MAAAALKMAEQGAQGDRAYRMMAYGQGKMPAVWPSTRRSFDPTEGAGDEELEEWACDVDEELDGEQDDGPDDGGPSHRRDACATDPGMRDACAADPGAREAARFEVIDVNLACPVKKIRARARGGHWLREPEGAIAILRAVRGAVPRHVPVTVKMRRSYNDTPEQARNFERIFNAAYELGCAWVTVHARTVEQKYVGPSRWPALRDLTRRYPDRLIFGSGDVWNAADIFRMIAYTGVHAVSVARGCIGNPWIFRQARAMMRGEPAPAPTITQQRAVMLEHLDLAIRLNGERLAGRTMRKFGVRFAGHHPRSDEVKARLVRCEDAAGWRGAIEELYGPASASRTAELA